MPLRRLLLILGLLVPARAAAQLPDTAGGTAIRPSAHPPIRWWHLPLAAGGVALVSLADLDIQHWIMDHRSQGAQDVADVWQLYGENVVPIGLTLGTLGAGVVLRKPEVTRTGGRMATSLVAVTLIGRGLKKTVGRARPSEAEDQYTFDPFGSWNSFPSGHTITAFAISTVLADAVDNRWADVGLYSLAAGTGVSRMVGNHHWLSDVTGAAILGITTAKVIDGKWRIGGLRPPTFLVGPDGMGLRWTAGLPRLRGPEAGGN